MNNSKQIEKNNVKNEQKKAVKLKKSWKLLKK